MTIYIYRSLNGYCFEERHSLAIPLRVYGNIPFIFDIENSILQLKYEGELIEEKYYSYDLSYKDKILIFKEF